MSTCLQLLVFTGHLSLIQAHLYDSNPTLRIFMLEAPQNTKLLQSILASMILARMFCRQGNSEKLPGVVGAHGGSIHPRDQTRFAFSPN